MERSAEVEALVNALYDAWASGDEDAIANLLHDDVLAIGTDPQEWWEGEEQVARIYTEQGEVLGGGLPLEPGETVGFSAGDVGWFAGRLEFVIGDERVPCRHTGVAVRNGGGWRLVQTHLSIGIANEWSVGSDLPG